MHFSKKKKIKESEFGRLLAEQIRQNGFTILKTHGNQYSKGFPDYMYWKEKKKTYHMELKRASSLSDAIRILNLKKNAAQKSIMKQLFKTQIGCILCWCSEEKPFNCGFIYIRSGYLTHETAELYYLYDSMYELSSLTDVCLFLSTMLCTLDGPSNKILPVDVMSSEDYRILREYL